MHAVEATAGLLERRPAARRKAVAAALNPRVPGSTRLALLASALHLQLAGRMLAREFEERQSEAS